jgi:hypothetical protein
MRCVSVPCLSSLVTLRWGRFAVGLWTVASVMLISTSSAVAQLPGPPGPNPVGEEEETVESIVITEFVGVNVIDDTWVFSGAVDGCDELSGVAITFGGIVSGSTVTGSDGSFAWVTTIPYGSEGFVTAAATCHHGHTSDVERYYVGSPGG